ncbi:hypothetical protein NL50_01300 [Clostridium acetobutylicum]|nr:hypothetical protein NL50_01300 [Clostridium acetobutylicum]
MYSIINKRKAGGVQIVVATLLGVLIMSSVFIYFISNMIPINNSYKAETIARKYMFKIEQDGYLKEDNAQIMKKEFSSIGIEDIDISGTTLNPVDYGSDVYLKVSYKENVKKVTVSSGIMPVFSNEKKTVVIEKSSTSKNVIRP